MNNNNLWLNLLLSGLCGAIGSCLLNRISTGFLASREQRESADPWERVEYDDDLFVDRDRSEIIGAVLVGNSDLDRLNKLAADMVEVIRDRADGAAVVTPPTTRSCNGQLSMRFRLDIVASEKPCQVTYNKVWNEEAWEIAQLSFEDKDWYESLIDHLASEAIEALFYAIERS
jgi:hypothetical protein